MRLVWAEITRLFGRRFTAVALIVLLLALGGSQLVVNKALAPPSGEERAAAQQAYDQAYKDWVANHDKYERDCRDTGGTPEECTVPEPTMADFSVDPTLVR